MLINPLAAAAPTPPPSDTFRLGTVTGLAPLRVRLDGDTAPLAGTPINTAGVLAVSDRVWTHLHGRSILVIGNLAKMSREAALNATVGALGQQLTALTAARKGERRLYTFPSRAWASGNFQQVSLTFGVVYDSPPLCVAYLTNAPSGAGRLITTVPDVTTTTALVRVWNPLSDAITVGGDVNVRLDVLPLPL